MSGEQKTKVLALSLLLYPIANILLLVIGGFEVRLFTKVAQIVANCVFGFFLLQGASWARMLVGIFSALGAIVVLITLAMGPVPLLTVPGIMLLLAVPYQAWVAYTLLLDKDVAQHFNPRGGF